MSDQSEVKDALDLNVDDAVRQTVFGDAVAQVAAELGVLFKDLDAIALFQQLRRDGQAAGAAADHGNGLAKTMRRLFEDLHAERLLKIGDVALDAADVNGLVDAAARAGELAVFFRGANACADRAENVVFADRLRRALEVAEADGTDEFAGVGPCRAGLGAGRVVTEQAARRLLADGHGGEARLKLLAILGFHTKKPPCFSGGGVPNFAAAKAGYQALF